MVIRPLVLYKAVSDNMNKVIIDPATQRQTAVTADL